jgi:T-complex protein 1 subunit eta
MAGELLKQAKSYIEEGIHAQVIIKGYRIALNKCLERISEVSVKINDKSPEERRDMLIKCAQTSLNSKLINKYREFFADMVVNAVETLDEDLDKSDIGIKKVTGGSVTDSLLIEGVAFKKTFSYAGFEQQPKKFTNPKIVLLNVELELKAEKENAEIRLEKPEDYQKIVDAEWKIIYDKLQQLVDSGAKVILSKLPIGDLATQYFADRGLFCAGRVQ